MLRILLADDSAIVRRGIRKLLEETPQFEICGEAEDGDEAVVQAEQLRPDVLLLDLSIPGMRGRDVIDVLRENNLPTRVIIISEQDKEILELLTRSFDIVHAIRKSRLAEELIPALDSL